MIQLTLISNALTDALDKSPLPLSKTFSLEFGDTPIKTTAAQLLQGRAQRCEVNGPQDFAELLPTLGPHQALTYGITNALDVEIVTQKELRKNPEQHRAKIARDRKHFTFGKEAAVFFIDYDPQSGAGPLSSEQVRDALIEAYAELADAPMVMWPSTSSYIYHGEKELNGPRGWHIYVFIKDGSDIERATNALDSRLWLRGRGRFDVSAAGTPLDRNLIDTSVSQPERLDFAAAKCVQPLEQRRPPPTVYNPDAPLFDTRLWLIDPTVEEQEAIAKKKVESRAAVEPERCKVRENWVAGRKAEIEARGLDPATAQRTAEYAVDSNVLLGDFELVTESGRKVTVAEVLANKKDYHGERFRDPLEPDYRNDHRIAYVNLFGGRPYLWSHAHGGQRFLLYPQTRTLKLQRGELPRLADAVLEGMRIAGDVYDQPVGEGRYRMVHIHEGYLLAVTEPWLRTYIGRLFRCERFDKRAKVCEPADVPKELVEAVLAESSHKLPVLEALIRDPSMRPDGTILDQPGYSERDRLLFESDDLDRPGVPENPTDDEIRAAFGVLWQPFNRFPFVDSHSRGVMVAALLTAVVRAMLDTAPAFLFEAPSAGSGKTLLGKCLYTLATALRAIPEAPPATDEESNKKLFSSLRAGVRAILWDNLTQPVYGNSALCAFLTAAFFSSRVLGISVIESLPNKTLLLMTGNNPRVEGDACRRVVRCRIDAQMERPSLRSFDMEPESYVFTHRTELWTAALTILRGFFSRGAPKQTRDTAGSFEQWDRMVRQCVIWLGCSGLVDVEVGDPYHSAVENMDNDPQRSTVLNLMRAWRAALGDKWKTAGEALTALEFADDVARGALQAIESKGFNAARFGYWLLKHCDERISGLRIEKRRDSDSGSWRYAVLASSALEPGLLASFDAETRAVLATYANHPCADLI